MEKVVKLTSSIMSVRIYDLHNNILALINILQTLTLSINLRSCSVLLYFISILSRLIIKI